MTKELRELAGNRTPVKLYIDDNIMRDLFDFGDARDLRIDDAAEYCIRNYLAYLEAQGCFPEDRGGD